MIFRSKTSCFGSDLVPFLMRINHLFYSKTTCFGLMKVYEGKDFAFISIKL